MVTPATCTVDGLEKRTCSCGAEETRSIPATGHSVEIRNAKEATCTESGYTGDKVCTVCTETVETGETIPALGHYYVNNKCTRCGDEKQSSTNFIVKLISSIVNTVTTIISKLFSWFK